VFGDAQLNLARHNVQVALRQVMEKCFVGAKKNRPRERRRSEETGRFRAQVLFEPAAKDGRMEEIMAKYEFMDDEIDDTK